MENEIKYTEKEIELLLKKHGIRLTGIRILILKEMFKFKNTFNLTDLEISLDTIDKSTIFRTIILFEEQHLLHSIEDGSGSVKYCVCTQDHICNINELHAHFHCEVCKQTFCIENEHIPLILLEDGFVAKSINYTIKGICPKCKDINHMN